MDFADEHYVKLFTRDTVTWRSWPWQARALFPLLMRAVDHAGILSVGTLEPARSVALMVMLPEDIVSPGIEALLADGTVELVSGALIIPRFNDAQESKKSNAQAKREQREKAKSIARGSQVIEATTAHRQTAAVSGRSGHPPSPALPCPTPSPTQSSAPRTKRASTGNPPSPTKVEKPPDPRHQPLVKALTDAYQRKRAEAYPFDGGKDAKLVTRLLARKPGDTAPDLWPMKLLAAWERALDSEFPGCSTLAMFDRDLPKFTGPPNGSAGRAQSFAGTGPITATEGSLF